MPAFGEIACTASGSNIERRGGVLPAAYGNAFYRDPARRKVEYLRAAVLSTSAQARTGRQCHPEAMNDISSARRAPHAWLPAVIAILVTGVCGLLALAGVASGALNDVAPDPGMGWLEAGLYAQAALGSPRSRCSS